jgi:hypothetical protein
MPSFPAVDLRMHGCQHVWVAVAKAENRGAAGCVDGWASFDIREIHPFATDGKWWRLVQVAMENLGLGHGLSGGDGAFQSGPGRWRGPCRSFCPACCLNMAQTP